MNRSVRCNDRTYCLTYAPEGIYTYGRKPDALMARPDTILPVLCHHRMPGGIIAAFCNPYHQRRRKAHDPILSGDDSWNMGYDGSLAMDND